MPFYDLQFAATSSGTGGTEVTHMAAKQTAGNETLSIMGMYAAGRFGNAGGNILRLKTNTAGGTVYSGGTAQTPTPKNPRAQAAQSTWANGGTTITAGTTLVIRAIAGFASTGGQGGMVPIVPGDAVKLLGSSTPNPVDAEWTSICSQASVTFDMAVEALEGSD